MTLTGWDGLLIGLVQGLTEFLPISSSGHLVLAERLVGYEPRGVFVEVAVHVATLLSVVIAYRGRIAELLGDLLTRRRGGWRYIGLLLLASVPAGIAGILGRDYFERTFHSLPALGWNFLITAGLLWSTRYIPRRSALGARGSALGAREPRAENREPSTDVPSAESRAPSHVPTIRQALIIGLAQAVAILPGVSRSGATITAGLWTGLAPAQAAEFSFLMSIIVIAGSGLLEARHLVQGTQDVSFGLAVAFVAALLAGIAAIKLLVLLLRRGRFHVFAPYVAVLGVLCLLWFAF
ncbi:MAG: undecaprenyl-diphosphate phosphatase [Gemmatimonadales bacterium]